MEARWAGHWNRDTNTSVLSIHSLQLHSAVFSRLLLHPPLLDCLESLVEGSIVLHHTKAHLKPAYSGCAFPTHQDYHYFPYTQHSMLAVFLHLDDTDQSNGGLGVFPGSHKLGPQTDVSTAPGIHYLDQSNGGLGVFPGSHKLGP